MVEWIQIARKWRYGETWLPSDADIGKSALFERIRNGKEPLEYPPPVALACPWYALVEDPGPHVVGGKELFTMVCFGTADNPYLNQDQVSIMQHAYDIVERVHHEAFIIKDHGYDTPYRFRLWYDSKYQWGRERIGCWLLQNVMFDQVA